MLPGLICIWTDIQVSDSPTHTDKHTHTCTHSTLKHIPQLCPVMHTSLSVLCFTHTCMHTHAHTLFTCSRSHWLLDPTLKYLKYVSKSMRTSENYFDMRHFPSICCSGSLHSAAFRLCTRFRNLFAGICSPSATGASLRSNTDAGPSGLAPSQHSSSSHRGCGGGSAQGHCHVETGNGFPQTVQINLESHYCLNYDCLL